MTALPDFKRTRKVYHRRRICLDRISALPNDVVYGIVSLLPIKEAAATSVISKRWKHVWKFSASLNFDDDDNVGDGEPFARFRGLEPKEMDQESRRYIYWVDSVMRKHRAPTIDRFRVCFDLHSRFTTSVDSWVEFAMNKRVQILELVFRSVYTIRGPNCRIDREIYQFPSNLLGLGNKESDLKQLKHLDSCDSTPSLHSCGCNGFNFLRVLHFREVNVNQEDLEHLLSKCPVLERLIVESARRLVGLRVAGFSIALKHLELTSCAALESVQICDTNLVSLTISRAAEIRLLLSNVPSLVEVSFNISRSMDLPHFFTQISRCTQLEMLMLNISVMDYNPSLAFPNFANLKHLELMVEQDSERGLQNLISFLQASPYLENLVLKLERWATRAYYKVIRNVNEMSQNPHFSLKVVEIENYRGKSCAKHIMYLIKNAAALEKLVIKPIRKLDPHAVNGEREEAMARQHVMRLKRKVPSYIEFLCI